MSKNLEKRRNNKFFEPAVDVEFDDDVYENKHKQWLARRRLISTFLGFLILAVVLVFSTVFLSGHESSKDNILINEFKAINNAVNGMMNPQAAYALVAPVDYKNVKTIEMNPPEPQPEVVQRETLIEKHSRLKSECNRIIRGIREMKSSGTVIESSPEAQLKVQELQTCLRNIIPQIYGPEPYIVEMKLEFPQSMPDYVTNGKDGVITFELGPLSLVPYSTYYFLDTIEKFKGGSFHRNAGHVLQAQVNAGGKERSAFQEYNKDFPHKQYTMGYAGRPGGPEFYISTVDNTENHGPGSQGSKTEADGCFAKIIPTEANINTVKRMQRQPGKQPPNGFIDRVENYIKIISLTLRRP